MISRFSVLALIPTAAIAQSFMKLRPKELHNKVGTTLLVFLGILITSELIFGLVNLSREFRNPKKESMRQQAIKKVTQILISLSAKKGDGEDSNQQAINNEDQIPQEDHEKKLNLESRIQRMKSMRSSKKRVTSEFQSFIGRDLRRPKTQPTGFFENPNFSNKAKPDLNPEKHPLDLDF